MKKAFYLIAVVGLLSASTSCMAAEHPPDTESTKISLENSKYNVNAITFTALDRYSADVILLEGNFTEVVPAAADVLAITGKSEKEFFVTKEKLLQPDVGKAPPIPNYLIKETNKLIPPDPGKIIRPVKGKIHRYSWRC